MIYAGMFGGNITSSSIPGHIFSANYNPGSSSPATWVDLTANPVSNSSLPFNAAGADISDIYIDPHDTTGNTIYVTLDAVPSNTTGETAIYRSTNGGGTWASIQSNLPFEPANAVAVDPQNSNVVYVALDSGVYYTSTVESCAGTGGGCWAPYGINLPNSPVVQLIATPLSASTQTLTAGTYGRGIWEIPLYSSGTTDTTATLTPTSINFGNEVENVPSSSSAMVLKNTGSAALAPTLITMTGNFSETDNCVGQSISAGATCTINVTFTPAALGALTGSMVVNANVSGGQLTAGFTGTGIAPGTLTLVPGSWNFGNQQVGTTSAAESFSVTNTGGTAVTISSVTAGAPFSVVSNSCGSSVAANSACAIGVVFKPTASGAASGSLTVVASSGTLTATLGGTGLSAPTATLSTTKLTFPSTSINSSSAPMTITMTNNGQEPLTGISTSISGYFSETDNCGSALAANSSCNFYVVFTPLSIVSGYTQNFYITTQLGQQTVTLVGNGVADPVISFTVGSYYFGNQEEFTSSSVFTLTLYNSGPTTVTGLGFSFTGLGASSMSASYAVASPCGTSLGGGLRCNIGIVFTPQSVGTIQANFVASSNYPVNQSTTIPVSGVGIQPPVITPSATSLSFGPVTEGTTSNSQFVTLKNTGGTALTDLQWGITAGAPPFAVTSATTCTASLPVSHTCNIYVDFAPTSTSAVNGVLTLSSASGAIAPIAITLSGSGSPPSVITTSVAEVDFGNQVTGQASSAQTVTVSANGSVALAGLTYTITSGSGFLTQAGTCGSTLSKSGSCTENIVFDPTVTGYQSATLTIATTTPYVSSVTVLLTGTGIAPALIQATPTQINFGSVLQGQTSAVVTETIVNSGGSSLTALTLAATGNFALSQNNCPATLAAGTGCSTGITFTPSTTGQINGTLSISTTAQGAANVSIPLTGYGLTTGSLTISPTTQNFGTESLGQSSGALPFTLTNTGGGAAGGLSFTTTGSFSISSQTCGVTLGGGSSCTIYVVFSPTTVGSQSGLLTVSSTTAGVATVYAGLTGTGNSGAALTASVSQLSFPSTAVNTTSAAETFVLSNPGTAAANGINIQSTGNFSNSTCPTTLAAGASCTVSVYFSPTQQGTITGTTTATSSTAGVPAAILQLSGTGTAPASLSLNPNSLSFPLTLVGVTSAPMGITVSNPGTAPLNMPSLSTTGSFAIQSSTCSSALAAGGNCSVEITFTPTVAGGSSGFLTVSSTTTGVATVNASLSGTGASPASFSVNPTSLTFPTLTPGQVSAAQTVTVTVNGGVGVSNILASADTGFQVTQNNCTGSYQSGGSCTVLVDFAPTAVESYSGQLTISGSGVQSPASVALSGLSVGPPTVLSSPGQVSFQTTGVGITSAPFTLQLTNESASVAVSGMQLSVQSTPLEGVNYQIAGTTCTSTLAAGANCTVSITFTPTAAGPAPSAWLVVNGSNLATPLSVPLYGIGLSFSLEPSGISSVTVASGQVANFNFAITIPPLSGAQGVFTLSCSNLPLNSACVFVPENCQTNCQPITTVTASAGSPGYATLGIQTGQASTSSASATNVLSRWPRGVIALCALLLLPLYRRRSRRLLLSILLLAVLVAGISSCTESRLLGVGPPGSGGGASSATPPGTYTIQVTATSDGLSESTSVTLTVD
jgi:hypothetical protein